MNTMKNTMKNTLHCILTSLACWAGLSVAAAQGTAFTYQGRLTANGLPANGLYDLKFALHDEAAGGNQWGDDQIMEAVEVSNGLFTVTLDFGPGIFDGAPRWLEIGVTLNGSGEDFTTLTPRQPLTPAPYAIHAGTASAAAPGAVVTSLNTLKDDVTIEAGANVTITPEGNSLVIAAAGAGGSGIWSVNANNAYYNAGNVGIGTATPASKLTLSAAGYGLEHTDGTRRLSSFLSATGGWLGTRTAHPLNFFVGDGGSSLTIDTGGRVGIGTTTPAARLTVRTTGAFSAYGIEHTDGTVRLSTYLDSAYGAWLGTRTSHGLNFFVNDGLPSLSVDTSGNVVMTPNGGTGGYGSTTFGAPNGESGLSIRGYSGTPNRADLRFNGSSVKLVAGPGGGPPGVTSGLAVTTAGNVGIGTDAPAQKLHVAGNAQVSGTLYTGGSASVCAITIRGGCDLAEPFPLDDDTIAKGSVVIIDDARPGHLKRSERAYDRRVAGIISGANGVNTGITLTQEGVMENGQNVALSGRVYVRADAAFGGIRPGDLLTTSDTPGHAMKASDHARAQGAILGKAMTALDAGQGFVLVLVTLQ